MSAQITSFTLFVSPPSLCSCLCGFADFLRAFFLCSRLPYSFSFPLLLCLPLHPSILCPRHYRGSWLNCLKHGNRQLGSAAVCAADRRRFIVSIAARVRWSLGRARLTAFLLLVSFSAAQHKRTLLQEAEQDAKKKFGNVMSLGHMFTLI